MPTVQLELGPGRPRRFIRDIATGRQTLTYDWQVGGVARLPNGLEMRRYLKDVFEIVEGDPLSAKVHCTMGGTQGRGDWRTSWTSESHMTCDADTFRVITTLSAFEGEACVFANTWTSEFPRDLV